MTEKHTPGPWIIGHHPQNACVYIVADEVGDIAALYGPDFSEMDDYGMWGDMPIREANARLIATAPDLLGALKALVQILRDARDAQDWDITTCNAAGMILGDVALDAIDDAKAAIAKAEGKL